MQIQRGHLTLVHSTVFPAQPCVKARPRLKLYLGGKYLAGSFNVATANDNPPLSPADKGPRPYHQATPPGWNAPFDDGDAP
jgi:hypothetical protein